MDDFQYKVISDRKDLIEYEKGLYNAFSRTSPDGWLMKNYKIVDQKRLQPMINYQDLLIYSVSKNNQALAYGGANINVAQKSQIGMMGFNLLNRDSEKNVCEGLNWYMTRKEKGEKFLHAYGAFFDFFFNDLKGKGFKAIYGSCSKKLLTIYTIVGFDPIDSKMINGEEEILLRIQL